MKNAKRNITLGVLFFLPVMFLLFLYPSTHNYNPLEIVNLNVKELNGFSSDNNEIIQLKDKITVLTFLGSKPNESMIATLNLKELVYDKFKGFKNFQVVAVLPYDAKDKLEDIKNSISAYEELKHWHYVLGSNEQIKQLFASLKSAEALDEYLATPSVFIIDKDLNQRGRIDDREKNEIAKNVNPFSKVEYNCLEVAQVKNKMSEDMRILFTEYRQKRKGNFDSSIRRADDLKEDNE
jgi:hypothetical protein